MTAGGDTSREARMAQLSVYRRLDGPTRLEMACRMSDEAHSVAAAGALHRLKAGDHRVRPVPSAEIIQPDR
ncbi:MAG: hypothetical protein ACRDFR_01030 [Candidatus Limnocylindria bacterium]